MTLASDDAFSWANRGEQVHGNVGGAGVAWRSRPGKGNRVEMGQWHPILAAVEGPTGVWRMIDPQGREYGRVEIRRIMNGTDTRYKTIWRGEVLGWATTLREACERIHRAYLRAHGPVPFAGYPRLGGRGRD